MRVDFRHLIVGLFLGAFVFLRLGNLHAYTHVEEGTHCEVCDIITTSQETTPFLNEPVVHFELDPVLPNAQLHAIDLGYQPPRYCFVLPRTVHNKPPPVV
ncbi:hypothetical protein [Sediminicola luteus]|uniref:Uncharacterized protein n=1 Tax=Sediminicola luteus TaxID=319238 RepID=A0A2A4GF62_9FLAO|nr:hypothetical protein [Sediminicola luteus]PCE66638.1 hypothetical protein B7P33_04915 [Sediminicola luteus]